MLLGDFMNKAISDSDQYYGDWYILGVGLPRFSKSVNVAPGINLRPLEETLTVFDLTAAGAVGFREWAVLEPIASACTFEIQSIREFDVTPGYNTLNRAWLASSLLLLCGFTRHLGVACSNYSWNDVAGHQQRTSHIFEEQLGEEGIDAAVFSSKRSLPKFAGGLLDYHLKLIVNDTARTDAINDADVDWILAHFDTFNRLAAESESFRFALEAAVDWRYAKDVRSAIARLWSGIEAILGIRSELIYRISLISAALLAPRGNERRAMFRRVKELYGLRSKAIHGAKMSDEKAKKALNGSFELLKDLILLSIESGHPLNQEDFDTALFD